MEMFFVTTFLHIYRSHITETMKKLLLALLPLALAGCNSTPGNGDIKDYMEPLFASCKNVELSGISKTNGSGDANAYQAEFDFTIKVDAKKLSQMRALYEEAKAQQAEFSTASTAYESRRKVLEEAIVEKERAFGLANERPTESRFAGRADPHFTPEERLAYDAVSAQWQASRAAAINEPTVALATLNKEWHAWLRERPATRFDTDRIGNTMVAFYEDGCKWPAGNFMTPMATGAVKSQVELFDKDKFELASAVTMRKMEKGWRVVGN